MAQIKPMPTHIREYYKAMREAYTQKREDAVKEIEKLTNNSVLLRTDILNRHEEYLKYNINLSKFSEFINNEYEDGHFLRVAKGAYLNRSNDYELTSDLYNLLNLAETQQKIYNIKKDIELYDKVLSVKTNDYIRYMREYFNIVHKKMILEGVAYQYGNRIGDVLINRVRYTSKRKAIDYKATKAKKAEIIANGGRVYNKEEAEFCESNGIEYNGQDGRVYLNQEYFYEIVLCNSTFPETHSFEFTPQIYRAPEIRKYSNKELIEVCNRNLDKICSLQIDLKTKITLCNEIDKMLYTNFIRNENQTSYKYTETSRKD